MKNQKALLSAVFAAFMLLSACGGSTQKDTSAQDSRPPLRSLLRPI